MLRKAIAVGFVVCSGVVASIVIIYLLAVYIDSIVKDNVIYSAILLLLGLSFALLLFYGISGTLSRRYQNDAQVTKADVYMVSALPFIPLIFLLAILLPHLLFGNTALVYHGGSSSLTKAVLKDMVKLSFVVLPALGVSLLLFVIAFVNFTNKPLLRFSKFTVALGLLFFTFCTASSVAFATLGMKRFHQVAVFSEETKLVDPPESVVCEAEYGWEVIRTEKEDSYEAYTYKFLKTGRLDLKTNGDSAAFTNIEFFVLINTIDNYPRPVFAKKRLKLKQKAHITVKVVDEVEGRETVCSSAAINRLLQEYHINAAIPEGICGPNSVIRIEVETPKGTIALLYRLLTYEQKEQPERVLLISLDSFALEHSSLFTQQEFDTNPMLRNLILHDRNTVAFSGAKSVSNWTLPSHATMYTGLYPTQHRMLRIDDDKVFSQDLSLLPELLKERRIEVFHLVSFMLVGSKYGYHRGVDCYKLYQRNKQRDLGERGRRLTKDAAEWMNESRDRDVFMFIHLFDSHSPYINYPKNYRELAAGIEPCDYPHETYGKVIEAINRGGFRIRKRAETRTKFIDVLQTYLPRVKIAYKLGLRDVDDILSEFFEQLKALDLFDNTTIIITSDHGEEFFNHGTFRHQSLYNEILSIPFIIKFARNSPYKQFLVDRENVSPFAFEAQTTIFKIILDLFSVDYPEYLADSHNNGLSLKQLLTMSENLDTFAEYYFKSGDKFSNYYEASLTDERLFKSIVTTYLYNDLSWRIENKYLQLYDLNLDKWDVNNLYPADYDQTAEIFGRTVEKAKIIRGLIFEPDVGQAMSEIDFSRIRALGYIR